MTVAELIARLAAFDGDMPVVLPGLDVDFMPVRRLEPELVVEVRGRIFPAEASDAGCFKAVRILRDGDPV